MSEQGPPDHHQGQEGQRPRENCKEENGEEGTVSGNRLGEEGTVSGNSLGEEGTIYKVKPDKKTEKSLTERSSKERGG